MAVGAGVAVTVGAGVAVGSGVAVGDGAVVIAGDGDGACVGSAGLSRPLPLPPLGLTLSENVMIAFALSLICGRLLPARTYVEPSARVIRISVILCVPVRATGTRKRALTLPSPSVQINRSDRAFRSHRSMYTAFRARP